MTTNALTNEIIQIVHDRWQREQKPTFLAHVGAKLSPIAKQELALSGLALKGYIGRHMGDQIRQFVIGDTGDVLVPANSAKALTDAELVGLYAPTPTLTRPSSHYTRFVKPVWEAFTHAITSGSRRFVDVRDGGRSEVHDVATDYSHPAEWIEIVESDLPARNEVGWVRPGDIVETIRSWAQRNKVEIEKLRDDSGQTGRAQSGQGVFPPLGSQRPAIDRLVEFLESLEPAELAKVSLSGEVLLGILRRRR